MPSLGAVETVQPIAAAPPNLRDEMCGSHRKRPATEDEDDSPGVTVDNSPGSPYAVLLAALRPKTKGAALFQDGQMGEPVLVFTGIRPPAPGAPDPSQKGRGDKKKSTAKAAAKEGGKDAPAAGASSGTSASEAAPAKPKPKKPQAKPAPATPASTQQTSQIRQ
jgi:D-alanyl-D-alanine carboxypeptidase